MKPILPNNSLPQHFMRSMRPVLPIVLLVLSTSLAPADPDSLNELVGKWIRPDGNYIMVVKSIGSDGKAEVQYFNPRPIHVAEASAVIKDGKATLFLKFEDNNYTGSTYNLVLAPDKSRLEGKYFQAIQKETYDIFFERMP